MGFLHRGAKRAAAVDQAFLRHAAVPVASGEGGRGNSSLRPARPAKRRGRQGDSDQTFII
jgi:hypothetical protein